MGIFLEFLVADWYLCLSFDARLLSLACEKGYKGFLVFFLADFFIFHYFLFPFLHFCRDSIGDFLNFYFLFRSWRFHSSIFWSYLYLFSLFS